MFVVIRGARDVRGIASQLRAIVARIEPGIPLSSIRTFKEIRAQFVADRRVAMILMLAFGSLTLVVATLGLYGLVTYVVQLSTREIGIRMALGASPERIRVEVLASGIRQAIVGIAVGGVCVVGVWRVIAARITGIGGGDPASIVLVGAGVPAVSLAATWFPARAATLVDPASTLRAQ
jgi:ABC-type lipoprotein release transport system permease subunit